MGNSDKTIKDAIRAADRQSRADITAAGACPLTKTDIQLVPVRYAYTAEASGHRAVSPRYKLGFQPVGVRQIRNGYLYLIHSDTPDLLQEYKISKGGAATPAIIVPRRGTVEVLFSVARLTDAKRTMLTQWTHYRREVMRKVPLADSCPITSETHLLTKPDLESLLLRPKPEAVPLDGQTKPGRWYWTQDTLDSVGKQGGDQKQDSGSAQSTLDGEQEPFAHYSPAYEQDHAYLIVDDLTGHLSDLLTAWATVDTNHNAWLEREDAKYYPARFISDLIRLDGNRLGELAEAYAEQTTDKDAKLIFEKIKQGTEEQQSRLARLIKGFSEYKHSKHQVESLALPNYVPSGSIFAHKERVTQTQDAIEKLAGELGLNQRELQGVINSIADYQKHLVEGSGWSGKRGIAELVQLDSMNTYLETANQDLDWFIQEKTRIASDCESLLAAFYRQRHFHDVDQDSYVAFLRMDNALINILSEHAQASCNFSFLKRFYFEEAGHQHLISLDLKERVFLGTLAELTGAFSAIMDAREGPSAYSDWVKLVENSPYLRFPSLSSEAAKELSHRLSQLTVVARLSLFELVSVTNAANLHGRLKQVFQTMTPGLRAYLFENQRLYEVDLNIADAATLARHEALVTELEHLAAEHKKAKAEREHLQEVRRKSKSNEHLKRQFGRQKSTHDRQVSEVTAREKMLERQLKERSSALMDSSPLEGDSHRGELLIGGMTRTADGRAVQHEIDQIKAIKQRGGLTKVWDYGRGLAHGQDSLDISRRIGGMGLVSFLGLMSAVGAWDAYDKWQKDDDWNEFWSFASGTASTIGAATSVMTIIGASRLNYYYTVVAQPDLVLTRLARVNVWGGTIAAWAGFFAAGADLIKQFLTVIGSQNTKGTKAGAGVSLVGDSMLTYGSGRMAVTGSSGIYQVIRKVSVDITWKSVSGGMLELAGGVFRGLNAYLWIGTGLVVAGNWVQNYFQRSEVQRWCEQSSWGNDPQGWDADQQRHELAKVIYQPTLSVMAEQHASNGKMTYCAFRLELPGLSVLQANTMKWAVLKQTGTSWDNDHIHWNQVITKKQDTLGGITLEVVLGDADLQTTDGFYLAFRYKAGDSSSWLPENGGAYYYKLSLHERGNLPAVPANSNKQWQSVKPLQKPDPRLTVLITRFHALTDEPDQA